MHITNGVDNNKVIINENTLYSLDDICKTFNVKESTVKRWFKDGLKHKTLNFKYYVLGHNLLEWLKINTNKLDIKTQRIAIRNDLYNHLASSIEHELHENLLILLSTYISETAKKEGK